MSNQARTAFKLILLSLSAIALALFLPKFLIFVEIMSFRIPQPDKVADYLKGVSAAFVIGISIFFWPISHSDRKALFYLWIVRSFVTLVVMLLYEWKYGLDAYQYYLHSIAPTIDTSKIDYGAGTINVSAFFWFLEHFFIPLNSYHAQKVICSLFGHIGIFLFYKALSNYFEIKDKKVLYFFTLFPSILFWSSILGKDPIYLFGICLFLYGAFPFLKQKKQRYLVPMILGLLVVSMIRKWGVPILIGPFIMLPIFRMRNMMAKIIFISAFSVVALFAVKSVSKSMSIESTEQLVDSVNYTSKAWNRGGSSSEIPQLNSISSMIAFLPYGIFSSLFRPLPGEIFNVFAMLSGFENLYLLTLLVLALFRAKKKDFELAIVPWSLFLVLIWSFTYAFISTQNLGSAARFKLQVMPVMTFVLMYLALPKLREKYSLH